MATLRFEGVYPLLFVLLASPGLAHATEVATGKQAILQGAQEGPADDFAAALLGDSGNLIGSAVWLGQGIAITAAHCLSGVDPLGVKLAFGERVDPPEVVEDVVVASTYPHYDATTGYGDLALLLTRDVEAPSIPVNEVPLTSVLLGHFVHVVGFGKDSAGTAGTKLARDANVLAIERDSFTFTLAACYGDSGGPVVLDLDGQPTLIGVTSRTGENCAGHSRATRLDPFAGWIEAETERLLEVKGYAASGGCAMVKTSGQMVPFPLLSLGLLVILCRLGRAKHRER